MNYSSKIITNIIRNQRGIAILIVLIVVVIMASLVFDFSYLVRVNLTSAENFRNGTKAAAFARSGIEACRALLRDNKNSYDSLNELWATERPPVVVDDGIVEIKLIDENSKINLNKVVTHDALDAEYQKNRLKRLFQLAGFDETIVDNILDWLDKDSNGAAENDYYLNLRKPYDCKNGPIDSLEELLLIKDINTEMFYGTKEHPGLNSLFTTQGNGKININTAPPLILQSLDDRLTDEIAFKIMNARENHPFKRIEDLKLRNEETGVSDALFNDISRYISVQSDAFMAESRAKTGEYSVRIQALLEKHGKKIFFWKRF